MTQAQILETVNYFRPIDFFRDLNQLSNEEIVQTIIVQSQTNEWEGDIIDSVDFERDQQEFNVPQSFRDLYVLLYDASRVWQLRSWELLFDKKEHEKEQSYTYCRDYAHVVEYLNAISRGAFSLSATPTSTLGTIDLKVNGVMQRLSFETDSDVFCFDFLRKLNVVLQPFGYQFYYSSDTYCNGFVLLLSETEKTSIEQNRGWVLN